MADAITPIRDGSFAFDPRLYPAVRAQPDDAAALLGHDRLPQTIDLPVWAYLIRTDEGPGLVDTGGGSTMGEGFGSLLGELARLGIALPDIRRICLTHLHGDHCGGLVEADGSAAFPNARLAVPDAEIAFWLETDQPVDRRPIVDDARRALTAYHGRIDRVAPGNQVGAALAVDAAGHTPGHTAWLFADAGALACGDIMHLRAIALARPDWSTDWDIEPTKAAATRLALMRRAADDGLDLLTGHGGRIAPAELIQHLDPVSA